MDYALSQDATKEDPSSVSRVRGLLCAISVSDIVTADRKYLEEILQLEHTAENTHPTKFSQKKHQLKKTG